MDFWPAMQIFMLKMSFWKIFDGSFGIFQFFASRSSAHWEIIFCCDPQDFCLLQPPIWNPGDGPDCCRSLMWFLCCRTTCLILTRRNTITKMKFKKVDSEFRNFFACYLSYFLISINIGKHTISGNILSDKINIIFVISSHKNLKFQISLILVILNADTLTLSLALVKRLKSASDDKTYVVYDLQIHPIC